MVDQSAGASGDAVWPRSVLVVDDRQYLGIVEQPKSIWLIDDPDALIVPYSMEAGAHHERVDMVRDFLRQAAQLIPGEWLVKNPYEASSYEFVEDAIENFPSAKYHLLANTARLLGARKVEFEEVTVQRDESNWLAEVKAKLPGGGGGADARREVSRRIEERLKGQMTFPGAEPRPNDALAFLVQHNLAADQQLRALVEMRSGGNPVMDYEMTLGASRESKINFKSALNIATSIPKAVDIGGSFRQVIESIGSVDIKTKIAF